MPIPGITASQYRRLPPTIIGGGSPPPAGFTAYPISFDGTNDYLKTESSSGSGCYVSASMWFYGSSAPSVTVFFSYGIASYLSLNTVPKLYWQAIPFRKRATGITLSLGWHHLCYSINNGSASTMKIYVDDSAWTSFDLSANTCFSWNSLNTIWANYDGSSKNYYDLAEYWADDSYVDWSDTATRRKVISATGTPVDLNSDGSAVTGSQPRIYFGNQQASAWNSGNNLGSDTGWSMFGSVTDSSNGPVAL